MKRMILLLAVLALLVTCFSGCGTIEKIFGRFTEDDKGMEDPALVEAVVSQCTACCRAGDIDGILDCMVSEIATPVRAIAKAANVLAGQDKEDIMETLLTLLGGEDLEDVLSSCETLQTHVEDVTFSGDHAEAKVSFTFTAQGQTYAGTTNVTFASQDGSWRIAKLSK